MVSIFFPSLAGQATCCFVGRAGERDSSWVVGEAGVFSCIAGDKGVLGIGEAEGCLLPDSTDDESVSGRGGPYGWSLPDCCGEGKVSEVETAAVNSLSAWSCRVAK